MTNTEKNSASTVAEQKQLVELTTRQLFEMHEQFCSVFSYLKHTNSNLSRQVNDAIDQLRDAAYGVGVILPDLIKKEVSHE